MLNLGLELHKSNSKLKYKRNVKTIYKVGGEYVSVILI